MKTIVFLFSTLLFTNTFSQTISKQEKTMEIAQNLVISAKEKSSPKLWFEKLKNLTEADMDAALTNDNAKKTFWINVYNGTVQHILTQSPELFEDRGKFYSKKQVNVAGQNLSLDDIEHGMIRGSKIKLSLGKATNPFAGKFEKRYRVEQTDGRIHFALNCGAKSCPYVGIYNHKEIDKQLDIVAEDYVKKTTRIEGNKVYVTTLFSWFRGDFGDLSGVKDFLKKYKIIPQDMKPDLEFLPYDWTLEIGNFMEL